MEGSTIRKSTYCIAGGGDLEKRNEIMRKLQCAVVSLALLFMPLNLLASAKDHVVEPLTFREMLSLMLIAFLRAVPIIGNGCPFQAAGSF